MEKNKMSDTIKWIYVQSSTGQPVHLVDSSHKLSDREPFKDAIGNVVDAEYWKKRGVDAEKEGYPIDISKADIEAEKPIKVPASGFVMGMIKDGPLKQVDAPRRTRTPSAPKE